MMMDMMVIWRRSITPYVEAAVGPGRLDGPAGGSSGVALSRMALTSALIMYSSFRMDRKVQQWNHWWLCPQMSKRPGASRSGILLMLKIADTSSHRQWRQKKPEVGIEAAKEDESAEYGDWVRRR